MKYCAHCILPDTRPGLVLEADGICNACHSHAEKKTIHWQMRADAFAQAAENAKQRSVGYDCLIPVSGGKDSTWQVIKCLEYGLNPLCVTWKTPARTALGEHNLQCLINLGVDHIDYRVSPAVEKKFLTLAYERYGSTAIPMHMALFNIPLNIAARFDIPLVVWGENSAFEYGGDEDERKGFAMTPQWLRKHGVTHGTTAEDWIGPELSRKELTPYFGPTPEALARVNAVFLGYYFSWDPETSLTAARKAGFRVREEGPKLGLYNYADIDDDFISIHHWLKWYKFGITRLFDNLTLEIRNGRMTRTEALDTLQRMGEQRPVEDIDAFCAFTGMSTQQFFKIAETFRNHKIWHKEDGVWKIRDFLLPEWTWA